MSGYQVRPEVLNVKPYIPGKPIAEVQRELGLTDIVKLASNENPLGPSPLAAQAIAEMIGGIHIYPEATAPDLRSALAAHVGLPADWIMVGNGSDELFRLLAAGYIRPGDPVVLPGCSFPTYRTMADLFGAKVAEVPLKDEAMDLEAMATAADGARMIFLCRPNNPTGGVFPADRFRQFMDRVGPKTIVLLDQAYHEYDGSEFPSMELLSTYPNLILTRTFSKAYGLAGLRVGYGMARPELWQPLFAIREPFSVNLVAQVAARAALKDHEHLRRSVESNRAGREFLVELCEGLGLGYIPSQGNFVMIHVGRPALEVYDALLRRGVIVRPVAGRQRWLRVSVGLPAEMERFAAALRAVLS